MDVGEKCARVVMRILLRIRDFWFLRKNNQVLAGTEWRNT